MVKTMVSGEDFPQQTNPVMFGDEVDILVDFVNSHEICMKAA